MYYDAVVLGDSDRDRAVTIHRRECEGRIVEAAEVICKRHRAVVIALEADTLFMAKAEVMFILNLHDVSRVRTCDCVKGKAETIGRSKRVEVSGGGRIIRHGTGAAVVVCDECLTPNPTSRVTCETCHSRLWDTPSQRLWDRNRRLRKAIRDKDAVQVGRMRHEISTIIRALDPKDRGKWEVGELGQAVMKSRVKTNKEATYGQDDT